MAASGSPTGMSRVCLIGHPCRRGVLLDPSCLGSKAPCHDPAAVHHVPESARSGSRMPWPADRTLWADIRRLARQLRVGIMSKGLCLHAKHVHNRSVDRPVGNTTDRHVVSPDPGNRVSPTPRSGLNETPKTCLGHKTFNRQDCHRDKDRPAGNVAAGHRTCGDLRTMPYRRIPGLRAGQAGGATWFSASGLGRRVLVRKVRAVLRGSDHAATHRPVLRAANGFGHWRVAEDRPSVVQGSSAHLGGRPDGPLDRWWGGMRRLADLRFGSVVGNPFPRPGTAIDGCRVALLPEKGNAA